MCEGRLVREYDEKILRIGGIVMVDAGRHEDEGIFWSVDASGVLAIDLAPGGDGSKQHTEPRRGVWLCP